MGPSLKSRGLKVITIANQKGGVGKTSSVIQIASGLAKKGERVLMIDGDPQGNLSLFFGALEKPGLDILLDTLASKGKLNINEYIVKNVRRKLDILPAPNRDLRLQEKDALISNSIAGFSAIVNALRENYDWILIDSSPSNSILERLLISASDSVIIPLEFQVFSVAGLQAIIDEVQTCSTLVGRTIEIHSLLFTKAENRLKRVETYRALFAKFHIAIYEICKSEYMSRSLEKSRTIWECGPSSYAAHDYLRLIEKGFL